MPRSTALAILTQHSPVSNSDSSIASEPTKRKSTPAAPPPGANRKTPQPKSWLGSQTLVRGLDILEAVAAGLTSLENIALAVKLNRSTTHRLAGTLVARRYLIFVPRTGYGLGAKTLELEHQARSQLDIPRIARDHLERLAGDTGDTVHLGVSEGDRCLYLDKISGRRRVEISSRIGELQPLRSTGLGKALLLDEDEAHLREFYRCENGSEHHYRVSETTWMKRMCDYAKRGCAFDLEENEDRIRCVAAPIRDASGGIKASISVSSAAQYMNDERMQVVAGQVRRTADQISRELGWVPPVDKKPNSRGHLR